jgi:cytochrome c peroxidase
MTRGFSIKNSFTLALVAASVVLCATSLAQPPDNAPGASRESNDKAMPSGEIVRLGRMLFEDPRLSANGTISCATCHRLKRAFTDGRPHAVGIQGQAGTRNTPTLVDIADEQLLFWDGRVSGLEQQVRSPLFNPREHGLIDDDAVRQILTSIPEYIAGFRKVFGSTSSLSTDELAAAIAAYERTLRSGESSFDRYWYGHQRDAISTSAQRGLELFRGRAGCAHCHLIGDLPAPLSDHQFHNSSVRLGPAVTRDLPHLTAKVVALKSQRDVKQLNDLIGSDHRIAELGRFLSTLDPGDIGKFRTPSLRNVALTAPYMHDGSVGSLETAVQLELYSRGLAGAKPIVLTSDEQAELVEFLRTLTSAKAQ